MFIFFACPKKTEPKERAPGDLPLRGALDSRLHWRSPKLATLKQRRAFPNEDSEPRLRQTGRVNQKPKSGGCDFSVFDFQSRHSSLGTTRILRSIERCLSVASLARAQNTEERKAPCEARRRIRVAFSLVRFFWPLKRNERAAICQE